MEKGERRMKLEGKTAVVTGAGSGIGQGVARRFAAEGARVVLADWRPEAAEETRSGLDAEGGHLVVSMDVSDSASVRDGLAAAVDQLGGVDVIVNAAGVTIVGGVESLTEEQWDRELNTNLKSIFLTSKALWAHFRDRGGGVIISIASDAGYSAIPEDAAYCASKAGVIMLTKCMALDGARAGIRATCICPGFISTPMLEGYFEDQPDPDAARAAAVDVTPMGRLGRPSDIAGAAVYLASEDAEWVTGTALVVDGGYLSGLYFA